MTKQEGFYIKRPSGHKMPFIFNAPHSGCDYSADFLNLCAVPLKALRTQEDFAMDKLFDVSINYGATLMAATFPRTFIDLNREAFELDPEMFDSSLPPFVNSITPLVLNGIGTIAKNCGIAGKIYRNKLNWKQALRRIEDFYMPYHSQLQKLLNETAEQFGFVVLLDCHSMSAKNSKSDIVIGDRFGLSAPLALRDYVCQAWRSLGYNVAENEPYAGGFITKNYGKPQNKQFAIQVELNRALYMDEERLEFNANYKKLQQDIESFIQLLTGFEFSTAQAAQ